MNVSGIRGSGYHAFILLGILFPAKSTRDKIDSNLQRDTFNYMVRSKQLLVMLDLGTRMEGRKLDDGNEQNRRWYFTTMMFLMLAIKSRSLILLNEPNPS